MKVSRHIREAAGPGEVDCLMVSGGDDIKFARGGGEFFTNITLQFCPPPQEGAACLSGRLLFPETEAFEFAGTLPQLVAVIRRASQWRDVVRSTRFTFTSTW